MEISVYGKKIYIFHYIKPDTYNVIANINLLYYWDLRPDFLTFVSMNVKLHERKNCRILSFNYLVFRNQPDKFIPPTF